MKLDLTVNKNAVPGFVTPVALIPREFCEALVREILAEFCLRFHPDDVYCVDPRSECIEVVAYLDEEDEEPPKIPLFFIVTVEDHGEYGAPLYVFFGRAPKKERIIFEAYLEIWSDRQGTIGIKGEVETAPKPDTPMSHGRYFPLARRTRQWRDGWEHGRKLAPTSPSPVYGDDPFYEDPLYKEALLMSAGAGSRGIQIEASSTPAYAAGLLMSESSVVDDLNFQRGVRDAVRGFPRSVNPIEEVENPFSGGMYLLGYDEALELFDEEDED